MSHNDFTQKTEFVGSVLTLRDVSADRQLDQTKWRCLASVSQEPQTPLASMGFRLRRLQDGKAGPLTPEQQNIAYTLARENKRLLKVGELHDVSRLALGTIQLDFQPVHLHQLVKFGVDTIGPQLLPKRLVLDVQVPTTLPPVRADIEKTTWVLLSLLARRGGRAYLSLWLGFSRGVSKTGYLAGCRLEAGGPLVVRAI